MKRAALKPTAFALQLLFCAFLFAADRTDEVFNPILKKSHEIISLPNAYTQNPSVTGKGVAIGIVDSQFNVAHQSLANKALGLYNNDFSFVGSSFKDAYGNIQHGSHVAAIAIGAKIDGAVPHGVAHEANFYGVAMNNTNRKCFYQGVENRIYDDLSDKNIKIINNSWGWMDEMFPLINRGYGILQDGMKGYNSVNGDYKSQKPLGVNDYFGILRSQELTNNYAVSDIIALSKMGILNIVANGNDGNISSSFLGSAAAYDEGLRAFIAVGALNAKQIEKDSKTGEITIKTSPLVFNGEFYTDKNGSGVAAFSNLFVGSSLYGIAAPGFEIYSANALKDADIQYTYYAEHGGTGLNDAVFIPLSGTSQATPMVSGAAALVQQKFGFLSGAQIADVLLSTANDRVKMPEIIVQAYNGGGAYNIIYVDKDPPKNGDVINKEQVKSDLEKIGYTSEQAQNILKNLRNTEQGAANNYNNEGILRLDPHEIIGQGILDVEKALRGLGRLDANRLNLGSTEKIGNEIHALYRLDTAGQNAEFSNDISQRIWDSKWHVEGALNSPKSELENVKKIGLEKLGAGILTLSGNNTYEGATRVKGGEIALTGKLAGDAYALESGRFSVANNAQIGGSAWAQDSGRFSLNGGQIQGSAYAQNGGIFALNGGTIGGSAWAQNRGVFEIQGAAKIQGNLTAQNGAQIKLTTPQTTLSAQSVKLDSGAILSGAGTITGSLTNNGGEVRAGFLDAALGFSPNATLSIEGGYSQDSNAKLQVAFDGKNFTRFNATSYDIKGGELTIVPHNFARMKNGEAVNLDLGDLGNYLNRFDLVKTWESNTLDYVYDAAQKQLQARLKTGALTPAASLDSPIGGQLLGEMLQLASYDSALEAMDALSKEEFQNEINAIYEPSSGGADEAFEAQQKNALDNVVYLLDSSPYALTRSFNRPELVRLAALQELLQRGVVSDVVARGSFVEAHKNQLLLDANYAILRKKSDKLDAIATNLQYKRIVGDDLMLGGFVDYARSSGQIRSAKIKNDKFTLGLSGIYDLESFSLLFSAHAGLGMNKNTIGDALPRSANFNDYAFGLSLGFSKDLVLSVVVLKPIWMLHYAGILQGGYSENGQLFAKRYGDTTRHLFASSLGAHFGYAGGGFYLGAFGFYNARYFASSAMNAAFVDMPLQMFVFRESARFAHSFYGGISAQIAIDRFLFRLGLSDELGGDYSQVRANATLGVSF